MLEEEEEQHASLHDQMMDAHGLLLELEHELSVLTDPKNTHIGVGFAFTKQVVKVVEIVTQKAVVVHALNATEDGGLVAEGQVYDDKCGIYAARVVAVSKYQKDISNTGPENIQFDKASMSFVVKIPGPIDAAFYN